MEVFVFKKEFLETIPDDINCDLERHPLENLSNNKELSVYRHKGFLAVYGYLQRLCIFK